MGEEKKTTYDNGILLNLKKSFKYAKGARLMLFLYIIFGALLAFIGVIAPLLSAKELLYVTDGTFKKLNLAMHEGKRDYSKVVSVGKSDDEFSKANVISRYSPIPDEFLSLPGTQGDLLYK